MPKGEFVHSISIDDLTGSGEATDHLIQLGHRRIAYSGDQPGCNPKCGGPQVADPSAPEYGAPLRRHAVQWKRIWDHLEKTGAEDLHFTGMPAELYAYLAAYKCLCT